MENTYTPAICKAAKTENGVEIPAPYRGTVTLRMPSFDERLSFYDDAGVAMDADGLAVDENKRRNKSLIRHVSRKIDKFFVRSAIVRTSDGFELDTLDKLQHDTDMMYVLMEIALKLVGKFNVGAMGNEDSNTLPNTSPPPIADTHDPGTPAAS